MLDEDGELMKHMSTELGVGERRGRGKFAGSGTPHPPPPKVAARDLVVSG
jgi:hypothetical protein